MYTAHTLPLKPTNSRYLTSIICLYTTLFYLPPRLLLGRIVGLVSRRKRTILMPPGPLIIPPPSPQPTPLLAHPRRNLSPRTTRVLRRCDVLAGDTDYFGPLDWHVIFLGLLEETDRCEHTPLPSPLREGRSSNGGSSSNDSLSSRAGTSIPAGAMKAWRSSWGGMKVMDLERFRRTVADIRRDPAFLGHAVRACFTPLPPPPTPPVHPL